jgi:hypothetical protein
MLLLLQAAAQQLPPIYVTVQTPPGMPEWEKSAIAAGIGALFAIVASIGMEFVKPAISNRLLNRNILKHLDTEFRDNYAALLDVGNMVRDYDAADDDLKQDIEKVVREIGMTAITTERFEHYKETQKARFYEADEGYRLAKFYLLVARGFKAFPNCDGLLMALEFEREHAKIRKMNEIKPLRMFSDLLSAIR